MTAGDMLPGDVLLDVSELVLLPLRTGIQRVTRELIRFWPEAGSRLRLCAYDPALDALRFLPEAVRPLLVAGASGAELTVEGERDAIHAMLAAEPPRPVSPDAGPVLNVELFINPGRAGFYERLVRDGRTDVFWLLYDFIPWLQPGWFPQFSSRTCMPFLHTALRMPNLAFISEATRRDFRDRIARNAGVDGPVIALGGDGLALERQAFRRDRAGYVVLGTLEPRKRGAAAMEAFQQVWSRGGTARLVVIGRLLDIAVRERELIDALAGERRFTFLPNASDETVRAALRTCRAMIFPSASEGFGLPPFEALHCGIPVVSAAGIPALDMLPADGRVEVADPLPGAIAAAVERLEDDAAAAALWAGAARQHVPTWRDFAEAASRWVAGALP